MWRSIVVNVSLIVFCAFANRVQAQADYNACNTALTLCPLVTQTINNLQADHTLCVNCEDDFAFCFNANNTIWLKFKTNPAGGNVQLNFSNISFENGANQDTEIQATILEALVPCNAGTYTAVGNCVAAGTANFSLVAPALAPATTYFIVISGALNGPGITTAAEATMDVTLSGPGAEHLPPAIAITTDTDTVCRNGILTATAIPTNCPDITSYRWLINGVETAVTSQPVFQTSEIQDGDVVAVRTSCYADCPVVVTMAAPPVGVVSFPVDAGPDFSISPGGAVTLQGSTTAPDYSWTPGGSLSSTTVLNPVAIPASTTTYFLTATDGTCTFSDEVTVTVSSPFVITNTFTPNGDGYNDTWEIPALEEYPNCFVQIFDRWGQSIYQTTGYALKKSWDGRSNGRVLTESVYFYVIDLRDPAFPDPFRGSITLIR
jgi:gliding motility-associated-like protein